jgi:DNA-binding transcriptional LysR family regulator
MSRLPSTQALQCFEASARFGSFTLAGTELHLTQGGVSRQVLGLEDRLGVNLFDRKRDGLVLTRAGQAYLQDIEPALREIERATANLMALQGQGGVLNVSMPPSWGNYWLLPRLMAFQASHPDISLNVVNKVGPSDFADRNIDAAVEFRALPRSDVESAFVMRLSVLPFCSAAFRTQHLDAIDARHMLQHTSLLQAWREWARVHRSDWASVSAAGPRYDLMFMAMSAASAGLGVALLPRFMAQGLVQSKRLVVWSPQAWHAGGYFLSRSPYCKNEAALQRFSQWLLAQPSAQERQRLG